MLATADLNGLELVVFFRHELPSPGLDMGRGSGSGHLLFEFSLLSS